MIKVKEILQICKLNLNMTNELNNLTICHNFDLISYKFNKIDGWVINGKTTQNHIEYKIKIIINEREQTITLLKPTKNGTQRTTWNKQGQMSMGLPNNQELLKERLGL